MAAMSTSLDQSIFLQLQLLSSTLLVLFAFCTPISLGFSCEDQTVTAATTITGDATVDIKRCTFTAAVTITGATTVSISGPNAVFSAGLTVRGTAGAATLRDLTIANGVNVAGTLLIDTLHLALAVGSPFVQQRVDISDVTIGSGGVLRLQSIIAANDTAIVLRRIVGSRAEVLSSQFRDNTNLTVVDSTFLRQRAMLGRFRTVRSKQRRQSLCPTCA